MENSQSFKQAIILNVNYTGANMALVTIFCEHTGLNKGIVKIAKKRQAELQKGNIIEYLHLKRQEDNLGTLKFNLLEQTFVKYFDNLTAIKNLNYITKQLIKFLKQDIPQATLFESTLKLLRNLDIDNSDSLIAMFDYNLLKEMGYTLDTKNHLKVDDDDLSPIAYVSPRSCRVVSLNLAKGYESKLLKLPKVLGGQEEENQTQLIKKINKLLLRNALNS